MKTAGNCRWHNNFMATAFTVGIKGSISVNTFFFVLIAVFVLQDEAGSPMRDHEPNRPPMAML
jgi:hypothetical protein